MNKLIKVEIQNNNGNLVVSSRAIAKGLEKEHKHVLTKIREVLNGSEFWPVEYVDEKGETRPEYFLNKNSFILLVMNYTGYNDFKRAYIKRFEEMEKELNLGTPKNFKEALYLAYKQQEEIEKLSETNETLEISLNTSLKFYTVAKYNKKFKMGWNMKKCQEIGKYLSAHCRANCIEIRKCYTNDERFTETNSYPITAWDGFFNATKCRLQPYISN